MGDSRTTPHLRMAARLRAAVETPGQQALTNSGSIMKASRNAGTSAPVPADLGLIDTLLRHGADLHAYARRNLYGPLPESPHDGADPYQWAAAAVPHTRGSRFALDAIAWRHAVEHALRIDGDQSLIRQQPCPACGCWGLVWAPHAHVVACANQRCVDDEGAPVTWTLRRLAVHAVRRANRTRTATS